MTNSQLIQQIDTLRMTNSQLIQQTDALEQSHQSQVSLLQSQLIPDDLVSQLQASLKLEQDKVEQLDYDIQYSVKEFEDMQQAHDKLKASFKCLNSQ